MDSGIGFRFHPSDVELVDHYLRHKLLGNDDEVWQIPEINVLSFEPWDLPQHAIVMDNSNDQVWYFFCTPHYKYSNSKRNDRTTNAGYWKVTGKDRKIGDIGIKRTLVFYKGRPKGNKTNWIMHEYVPTFHFQTERDFVICKIKRRVDGDAEDMPEFAQGESSTPAAAAPVASYTENQSFNCYNTTPQVQEFDQEMQAYTQSFRDYNASDYSLDSAFQWQNNHYYQGNY